MSKPISRVPRSQSPSIRFPLFAQAGRDAAALWLAGAPMTMSDWREARLRMFLAGLGHFEDLAARTAEFNGAYAQRIGQAIVSVEVRRG